MKYLLILALLANTATARPLPDTIDFTGKLPALPSRINKETAQCIKTLAASRGGIELNQYLKSSVRRDVVFVKYMMLIMYVESDFQPHLISPKKAYGIMQMTQGAVDDASSYCKLPPISVTRMLRPATGIRYGSCYLMKLNKEVGGDWTRTLITYNGGYRSLTRFVKTGTVVRETTDYIHQVHGVLTDCSKRGDRE